MTTQLVKPALTHALQEKQALETKAADLASEVEKSKGAESDLKAKLDEVQASLAATQSEKQAALEKVEASEKKIKELEEKEKPAAEAEQAEA